MTEAHGIAAEIEDDGRIVVRFESFLHTNISARRRRAIRILFNIRRGWRCRDCREDIPTERRADAVYCREACRKAAARRRRAFRHAFSAPQRAR